MTVKELIEKLQKCDPDAAVVVATDNQTGPAGDVLVFDVSGYKYVRIVRA